MAVNQTTLADQDGDYSPWLEVRNPTAESVNLQGWKLTDDLLAPGKWIFPSAMVAPGQCLVVFASGKNRAVSGQELHTNFRLSSGGGYLGLRRPDGTLASDWDYPAQAADLSYGRYLCVVASHALATNGAVASYFVPVSGAPAGWTNRQFDASGWPVGSTPIGFDLTGSIRSYSDMMLAEQPRYYWNFDESGGAAFNVANPAGLGDWLWPQGSATRISQTTLSLGNCAKLDGKSGTRFLANNLDAAADLPAPWAVSCWFRPANNTQASYLLEGQSASGAPNEPGLIYGYNAQRLEIYGWNSGRTGTNGSVVADTKWHHVVFAFLGSAAGDGLANIHQVYLDGQLATSLTNSFSGPLAFGAGGLGIGATRDSQSFFNGDMDEIGVYDLGAFADAGSALAFLAGLASNHWSAVMTTNFGSGIATDIRGSMANRTSSLCLRYGLEAPNPAAFNRLKLRAHYNDGFAAWLNGERVLLANAPIDLAWQSTSLTNRQPKKALQADEFDLSAYIGLLSTGANSMAIQGLNSSISSPEFFFQTQLLLQSGNDETGYMPAASPGSLNPDVEKLSFGPMVLVQPQDEVASNGGMATFTVFAAGAGPLGYKWFFNGVELPEGTNASYSIASSSLENEGIYHVLVTDSTGETLSESARLVLQIPPQITGQPQSLSLVPGQSASFLVTLNPGAALPIRYQWYKGAVLVSDSWINHTANRLTLGPVSPDDMGVYTVRAGNSDGVIVSDPAALTVLADADSDGLPDEWMTLHFGHATGQAPDGSRPQDDPDGDGANNRSEYMAGTNPLEAASVLALTPDGFPDAPTLSFQASSNRTYSLQQAGELPVRNGWQTLQDIAAHPTNRTVLVRLPDSSSNRFYRLKSPASGKRLILSAAPGNDIYQALLASGANVARYDSPSNAVDAAQAGEGVLVLADYYPSQRTALDASLFQSARQKQLRLYVEYPSYLPGVAVSGTATVAWERGVVTSTGFLAPAMQAGRILSPQNCVFLPLAAPNPHLVLARVAGYDTAVYGLPSTTYPMLFELPVGAQNAPVLVATTKLSQVITARYEPVAAWQSVWRSILAWVSPETEVELAWQADVQPGHSRMNTLPAEAEPLALERGIDWFNQSRLLVDASRTNAIAQAAAGSGRIAAPPADAPVGDGSLGILEGYVSRIQPDGSQFQSVSIRGDCVTESAMAFALGGYALRNAENAATATRLLDYWYFVSPGCKGERGDTNHPSFGLSAWGISSPAWYVANYGDDNARVMLATMAAAGALDEHRWDEKLLLGLLANLRTSGNSGFRGDRIDQPALSANGWEYYFWGNITNCAPHFESYLWACYLWAYDKTGYGLFRDRARTGIYTIMEQYPDGWRWTNGMQQERARMLLALAWLVRVEDTAQHRGWLRQVANDLLLFQDASGAIAERIGALNMGMARPPASNEEYGVFETPLLQENGDPVSDMLYTCNFAFLGLHEAAAATGDAYYSQAEDRLAKFLCRIQARSTKHPELDGAWFRAFDFELWDYWASNADAGWGAWSIETGWTQGWITSVLAMRQAQTSLWDLTAQSGIASHMDKWASYMIPPSVLAGVRQSIQSDAIDKSISLATSYSPNYPGSGAATLVDGILGSVGQLRPDWLGYYGNNLDATIDLGQPLPIGRIDLTCLQSIPVGIYLPSQVVIYAGDSLATMAPLRTINVAPQTVSGPFRSRISAIGLNVMARYIRVVAQNIGTIPSGNPGGNTPAWLFVDEISVNPAPASP